MGERLRIAVLFGGCSAEHEVSLQSARAVAEHLDAARYAPVLVGITRRGEWLRFHGSPAQMGADGWQREALCTPAHISPCRGGAGGLLELAQGEAARFTRLDAAFPVLHGPLGEDGTVQGLLELAGIPVVGCGTLASALCMDKAMAHTVAAAAGVAVPRSFVFPAGVDMADLSRAARALGYPLFVKPVRAGSSFGVSRVETEAALEGAVACAFRQDARILLEEAVEGFEVGCALLGNEAPTTGALDEVELAGGFFDYTEKYNLITSKIHVPARLDAATTARLKQTATTIYQALGCRGFARVDMFLRPDGQILFNEVNTIPGFTPHSRYPAMMAAAGIGFGELLGRMVELAVAS